MLPERQFCTYISSWGGTSGSFALAAVFGPLGSVGVSQVEERWFGAPGMGREGAGGVVPAAQRRISGIGLRGLHFQVPARLAQSPVARLALSPVAVELRRSAKVSARPFTSCSPGPESRP